MSKTRSSAEVWMMGNLGRAQKNCLGPIFQQMRMLLDFYCSFTSMVLIIGGGQRSYCKCQKLSVELVRNKPKPVWIHWMTGVSRIEFDIPASNTGLKNGACTFIARISLGGLPPSRHGTSTSCCFSVVWVHWSALFCHLSQLFSLRSRKTAVSSYIRHPCTKVVDYIQWTKV